MTGNGSRNGPAAADVVAAGANAEGRVAGETTKVWWCTTETRIVKEGLPTKASYKQSRAIGTYSLERNPTGLGLD